MLIGTVIIATPALPQQQITSDIIVDDMALRAPRNAQNSPVSDLIEEEVVEPINPYDCSCVKYVRQNAPDIDFPPIPDPSYLEPNTTPCMGCVVLFKFNGYDHMGISKYGFKKGGFFVSHQYIKDNECITEDARFIEWQNPTMEVRGFYK